MTTKNPTLDGVNRRRRAGSPIGIVSRIARVNEGPSLQTFLTLGARRIERAAYTHDPSSLTKREY
jgi:hypothetical protein